MLREVLMYGVAGLVILVLAPVALKVGQRIAAMLVEQKKKRRGGDGV